MSNVFGILSNKGITKNYTKTSALCVVINMPTITNTISRDDHMDKLEDLKSPQLIPGRKKPPAPWDDRKREGMSLGELLTEKVEDLIDVEDKLV